MLFKNAVLEKILSGEIRLAFRKWTKPTVKSGTQLHTPIGLLGIGQMKVVALSPIPEKEARLAGYKDLKQLKAELMSRPEGKIYRIPLKYEGEDPRLALREKTKFSETEKDTILLKAKNFDKRSPRGPWVKNFLELISKNPGVRAAELAKSLNTETLKFKNDVRKLKNLGLTISLGTGYKISPRGRSVLKML